MANLTANPTSPAPELTVREFLASLGARLELSVEPGRGELERRIDVPAIQKTGLIMAGLFQFYQADRLQIFGRSEVLYVESAGPDAGGAIADRLCSGTVPAFLISHGLHAPAALQGAADRAGIPVLVSGRGTDEVVEVLLRYLVTRLAPRTQVHAVLMDIHGLGVLIVGESGIGKSECALELVTRGHRLVADDLVEIRAVDDHLIGGPPDLTRQLMEIRGLGVVNAAEMFGVSSTLQSRVIDQVVRLFRYEPGTPVDRLGSQRTWELLGWQLPLVEMPVAPGRNLAVLVEMAVRQQMLRMQGRDASEQLQRSVARKIAAQGPGGRVP
ncbi:MAG: HPr(Ser) kinase/phosphatase [Acidobacteria bacterium]|nr:HPr(Ser) kinase/phosphatase [Acidobacteriota bacterium]